MIVKSKRVQMICDAEQISEDEFQQMARLSALVSNGEFNRRFHSWMLDIRNGVCQNMQIDPMMTVGQQVHGGWIEEEHYECNGEGCHSCGWAGRVRRLF